MDLPVGGDVDGGGAVDGADVEVDAKQDATRIYCDPNKTELIATYDDVDVEKIEEHKFVFRIPSFADTVKILDSAVEFSGVSSKINLHSMRLFRISTLLTSWTLTKERPTQKDIERLHPLVASVLSMQIDNKFNEYGI